jgi:hypothetical protein
VTTVAARGEVWLYPGDAGWRFVGRRGGAERIEAGDAGVAGSARGRRALTV